MLFVGLFLPLEALAKTKAQCDSERNIIRDILIIELSRETNRNWARLIQKIYEVDPLTCPQCQGPMRIISFIEDQEVIDKILRHLGLWQNKL